MKKSYVIWDKFDHVIHRGPWSKKECLAWLVRCRKVMPRSQGVDEVFEMRKAVSVPAVAFVSQLRKLATRL